MMVAILCCLFAITASAKHEYTPLTDEALSSLDVDIILTDGTNEFSAKMNFKDLFNYSLTTKTDTVAYSLKLSGIKATTITVDETEYTLTKSMVGIYFPDGVTHLNDSFMRIYSTVFSKAYLPDSIESIGDSVFYQCGTFSLIDENGELDKFLPENLTNIGKTDAWGNQDDHFLSGCTLQNTILVFPEGLTNFNGRFSFNDGYSNDSNLHLVFLGEMTAIDIASYPTNKGVFLYFAKNDASDAKILAGESECNTVETRLIDGEWCYAYSDSTTGADLSTTTDNTGKTLTIKIANNDPNSETALSSSVDGKKWRKVSSIARKFYFCSGEMILSMRNGTFGYKVYISDPITTNDVHPYEDDGVVVEPTCTIGGGTRYSCGVCGSFIRLEDETSAALGHLYTEDDIVSSTSLSCTEDETKTYECQRCTEQFVIVLTETQGHDYSIITYPLEATFNSLGTKRTSCTNCTEYLEFTYRLDPGDDMAKIVLDDGTVLEVKASELFSYTFDEVAQTAVISDLKDATFTVGDKTFTTSQIYSIRVPFGFTGIGRYNGRSVEVMDFSLTDGFTIGSEAFRDNHSIHWVILGNNIKVLTDAFRCPLNFKGIKIADGVSVVFSSSNSIFNDIRTDVEIIIGKDATVNFAKENFTSGNVDARLINLVIGDGSTVIFGTNAFNDLTTLEQITIGENCNLSFGANSFGCANALKSLIFPESTTVTFTGNNSFKGCTSLESIYLPVSVTSIPQETFANCTALKTVAFSGVTSISNLAFSTTSDTAPLTIYHHGTDAFTYISNTFDGRTTNGVILYTASNMTELTGIPYTIYCGIPHTQYEHTEEETCLENGYIGYKTDCPCGEAVYDVTYTIYTSTSEETTEGSYGSFVLLDEFDGHNNETTVVFESFTVDGTKTVACLRCGEVESTEVLGAIIVPIGYSIRDGGTGISTGYKLNQKSLEEYERVNGKLEIGLIIVNGNSEFNGSFLTNEFKLNSNYGIQLAVTQRDFALVNCSVVGFTDAEANLKLIFTAYVIYEDENGNKVVEYIQRDGGENYYADTVSPETNLTFGVMTIGQVQEILDAAGNIDTPKAVLPSNDEDIIA